MDTQAIVFDLTSFTLSNWVSQNFSTPTAVFMD